MHNHSSIVSPAVSVILPVYNGANYLRFAIESVLNQTLRDFELIVVDDGSTDSSPDIIRSYGTRLKYLRKENGGVATAFNAGIKASSGRHISWLSHDDVFMPAKLELQVSALSRQVAPAVCYTDIEFIDEEGVITEERKLPEYERREVMRNLLVSGPIVMASYSLLYDRGCLDEIGMYDESQRNTQDADMLIKLARRFPLTRVPQSLMQVRRHSAQGSSNKQWQADALKFYRQWLHELSLEEVFPELAEGDSGLQRARARQWLGDRYAATKMAPFGKLAMSQYLSALRESPAILRTVLPRIARLGKRFVGDHRQFYRLGLRTALARRFGGSPRQGKV